MRLRIGKRKDMAVYEALLFLTQNPTTGSFLIGKMRNTDMRSSITREKLNPSTAVIAAGCDAACAFVNR